MRGKDEKCNHYIHCSVILSAIIDHKYTPCWCCVNKECHAFHFGCRKWQLIKVRKTTMRKLLKRRMAGHR